MNQQLRTNHIWMLLYKTRNRDQLVSLSKAFDTSLPLKSMLTQRKLVTVVNMVA